MIQSKKHLELSIDQLNFLEKNLHKTLLPKTTHHKKYHTLIHIFNEFEDMKHKQTTEEEFQKGVCDLSNKVIQYFDIDFYIWQIFDQLRYSKIKKQRQILNEIKIFINKNELNNERYCECADH